VNDVRITAAALIATYSPTSEVLELAQVLVSAGIPVMVSDDASPCTSDLVLNQLRTIPGVEVIRHDHNEGIARGLNEGLTWARNQGAQWLVTFDQDSIVDENYVNEITGFAQSHYSLWNSETHIGAVGAGRVLDESGELHYPITVVVSAGGELSCTEEVIQSGTLWSVDAMTLVGGFDETLGIDAVDAAACLRLREQGYRIALAQDLELHHRLGEARAVKIFGKSVLATGHSGERRATMMRNRLRLAPAEFKQSPKHALRTLRRVGVNALLGATVEGDRWEKIKGSIKGISKK
jgi:rhamnosyltransferase